MKVSHRELTELERNPEAWALRRRSAAARRFSVGYDKVLSLGIRAFERHGSAPEARQHMQRILLRNELKKSQKIEDLMDRFERYVGWRTSSGLSVMETAARLKCEIGPVTLTGEVDRVELVDQGYRGVLLGKSTADWQNELRMPLLQKALASRYEKPVESFAVGVQELDASGLQEIRFDAGQIEKAGARLAELIQESRIEDK